MRLFSTIKINPKTIFWIVMLAGLVHGLLYAFLIPPWQHYDEPGHFEYAWLIANHRDYLASNKFDTGMRREVAASMMEHNFFEGLDLHPNLLLTGGNIWIGISQTTDPPLYYALVAAPLILARYTDVAFQLYLGRLVSLALYLLTIAMSFGIMAELTAPSHPLRWLAPATIVLLPGFTDLMTAVNNDVGAVAALTIFLWAGIRLTRKGFSILRLAAVVGSAALCVLTKSTAAFALPLLMIPLLFSLFTGSRRWLAWAAVGLAILGGIAISLRGGAAALWYPSEYTSQYQFSSPDAPLGSRVFRLTSQPGKTQAQIIQIIPPDRTQLLLGQTVTLGAWVWADAPTTAYLPTLYNTPKASRGSITTDIEPVFYAISTTVPADTALLRVMLIAPPANPEAPANIYYDGVILIPGDFTARGTPGFSSPDGSAGSWGGQEFTNLVRNASAESGWSAVHPVIDAAISRFFHIQPSTVLISFGDAPGAGWYYQSTATTLLRTFWARFGWGHVSLPGGKPYRLLGILTAAGIIGILPLVWRKRRTLPWDVTSLVIGALILSWGAAIARGTQSLTSEAFIPSARYAYPVIIFSILALVSGWLEIARIISHWVRIPLWVFGVPYGLGFLGLDIVSVVTILNYYHFN